MEVIHFLNVLNGDCNIIQHSSGRTTVIDVNNAFDADDSEEEKRVKSSPEYKSMFNTMPVPSGKKNYGRKKLPDNPIEYLNRVKKNNQVWRFVITHPDMDHLGGIKDFFSSFSVQNVWDTENKEEKDFSKPGPYNKEDWEFYKSIRDDNAHERRLCKHAKDTGDFWSNDNLHVLAPTPELVDAACECGDYHHSSYVILFTPPKKGGGRWKFLFAGDSHDKTWEYILGDPELKKMVSNVDVLFAPHHGRDSDRSYEFLKTLNPTYTLFGNAKSKFLAYDKYPEDRITNNQAGYVVFKITEERYDIYVENKEFAVDYRQNPKRNWKDEPGYSNDYEAWHLVGNRA